MDWILTLSLICGQLIKIPFGLGGVTILDLAVIFLILINFNKLKKPPLFIKAGLIFLLVCIISLAATPLHLSQTEYLNSFSYTARFALYLSLGLVTIQNPIRILKISGISLAILGFLQFIFFPDLRFLEPAGWDPHYFRAVSTFLDPNFLGAYFVLTALVLRGEKILFAIIYVALLLTFSRSSYLMFLVSFATLSYLLKSKIYFLITLLLFLGLIIGFFIFTQLITTPHGVDRQASASYRLGTWQQGLNIFQKSPIFGVGFNTYHYAIRDYNLASDRFLNSRGSTTNDFSLFYVLATTGVIGLIAYIAFLTSIFKAKSKITLSFLSGLLVHSIFNNSLFYPFILIWIIILAESPRK